MAQSFCARGRPFDMTSSVGDASMFLALVCSCCCFVSVRDWWDCTKPDLPCMPGTGTDRMVSQKGFSWPILTGPKSFHLHGCLHETQSYANKLGMSFARDSRNESEGSFRVSKHCNLSSQWFVQTGRKRTQNLMDRWTRLLHKFALLLFKLGFTTRASRLLRVSERANG